MPEWVSEPAPVSILTKKNKADILRLANDKKLGEDYIMWMELLATSLFATVRGTTVVEPWTVVEQPDLILELENAPVLRTESLGEPARGVNTWEHWAVPNPDGKSWDELQLYFFFGYRRFSTSPPAPSPTRRGETTPPSLVGKGAGGLGLSSEFISQSTTAPNFH